MEVVVLVVVEGIRDVERKQGRSPRPPIYPITGKSTPSASDNPLNYPISFARATGHSKPLPRYPARFRLGSVRFLEWIDQHFGEWAWMSATIEKIHEHDHDHPNKKEDPTSQAALDKIQSHAERKARKALLTLDLKRVPGITRVTLHRPKNVRTS
jgi:hypothetical protein